MTVSAPYAFPLTLTGGRVELRTLDVTFDNARMLFDAVVKNRDHLLPWMLWASEAVTRTPEDSFNGLLRRQEGRDDKTKYDFGLFLGDRYIGNMGIFDISMEKKSAEIGYWLAKDATGKGYMTEAVKLLEDEAFLNLDLNRIMIKCDPRNIASANVAKRLGYTFEGVLRETTYSDVEKRFVDDAVYSKLRAAWENARIEASLRAE